MSGDRSSKDPGVPYSVARGQTKKSYSYLEAAIAFKFLKDWAELVAIDIYSNDESDCNWLDVSTVKKIQSIILESMSPAKVWKNAK